LVVQRVVRETSAAVQYPMLTRTNYQEWSLLMKVNLQAQGMWYAVEPEEDEEVEYRDDRLAYAAILRSIPPEMLGRMARKKTAQATWGGIKIVCVGDAHAKEANAQTLQCELAEIAFQPGESVDDTLANKLRIMGDDIDESDVVNKLLLVVPDGLTQVAISIETLLDVNRLSLEEVTGRLRTVEQRRKKGSTVTDDHGRLLLTEEEWLARMKISGGENSKAGEQGGGKNNRGGKTGSKSARPVVKCSYCGKKGHEADVYRSKARKAQAKITKGEEDDDGPSLFMAHVVAIDTDAIPKPSGSEPVDQPPPPVEIVEANVLAELDDGGEHDDTVWYLDSGATNHMCGERSAFSNLDSNIKGTISFGDGSVAKIEGHGTILFAGKDGSHRPLTGVYFIPRLTSNIISLGQLDEAGCDIRIRHGLLKIHDDRDTRRWSRLRQDGVCGCSEQIMVANSPRSSSRCTALVKVCNDSTRRPTPLNRTGL
jgi:hypothetical protein